MKEDDIGEFQHHHVTFEELIRCYLKHNLKHDDWETLAVDPHKRIVVLRRFEPPANEHFSKGSPSLKKKKEKQ